MVTVNSMTKGTNRYIYTKDNNGENDGFCYYFDNNNGGLTNKQTKKQLISL